MNLIFRIIFPRKFMESNKKLYSNLAIGTFKTHVPEEKKSWNIPYDDYCPSELSFDHGKKPWADPIDIKDKNFAPRWNDADGKIDRRSHIGPYKIVDGYPLNPLGRTGIKGKGVLGRWGPNHAADPVVTRWRIDETRSKVVGKRGPILQFVAIQRRDTKEWAIPGGMVDPGELISATLLREFGEEAMNSLEMGEEEYKNLKNQLTDFFEKQGVEIYRGPVDDPRNTDNAWMETIVYNFHDEEGSIVGKFDLKAGDDAQSVKWIDVDRSMKLYANHSMFLEKVVERLEAHW
ncbi:ADP-ribose pyrophosphatase, mitochondrial [Brevipalpus obovatus]|uniref:ADP-ribose pyrophosphatase, mitochondrial n=1 Tax=Brevipalpus obovatus TaxID=246614 RepID=UPI003D9DC574